MLTTTDDPREVERCYQLGCNVYITKPVDYDEFVEAIKQLGLFLQVVKVPANGAGERGRARCHEPTGRRDRPDPRGRRRGRPARAAPARARRLRRRSSPPRPRRPWRALEAGGIDLMVLDYQLAGPASGLDFYDQLRAAGLDVPAILVTGFGDEAMLAQALRAGLRDFLPKTPDYLDYLVPTVDRVIGQVRTERALAARQRDARARAAAERAAPAGWPRSSSRLAAALRRRRRAPPPGRGGAGPDRRRAGPSPSLAPDGDWSRAAHASAPEGPRRRPPPRAPPPRSAGRTARPGSTATPPAARGWLAAPLIGRRGRNMGLVQLFDKADGPFTEGDEAILVQIAQMAGVAVENARLYQELRDNDRRKDEFLAMLAHELRNPLAAINNAVQRRPAAGGADEALAWAERGRSTARSAPRPADRRPARRLADHPGQDPAPQGAARPRPRSSRGPSRRSGRWSTRGGTR